MLFVIRCMLYAIHNTIHESLYASRTTIPYRLTIKNSASRLGLNRLTPINHRLATNPSTLVEKVRQIKYFFYEAKPIYWTLKMNVTTVLTKNYWNLWLASHPKNKPNTNPIKANLTQFQSKNVN